MNLSFKKCVYDYKPRVVIALVLYTNTQLIFRYVQYAKFKFVTENANADPVGREHIALWTQIAEKVVNVE